MIKLINGRGQIGEQLKKDLSKHNRIMEDVYIYHTWNVFDKSKSVQLEEYKKFIVFVDKHKDKKIIFTSTYSEKENWYNHYKQLSEVYLMANSKKSLVLKIPTIIGKGVCKKIKEEEIEPYGIMELVTIEDVSKKVIELCSYGGHIKSFRMNGELISAKIVHSLFKV